MSNKREDYISWDEYFIEIAKLVSTRSTCLRRRVGAILVKDHMVIATGYNGSPKGLSHCIDRGYCPRADKKPGDGYEVCMAVHAEQNAIINAAYYGAPTKGVVMYCTHYPCRDCAKSLINAGVRQVVYAEERPDASAEAILEMAGIEVKRMPQKEGEHG